MGWWLKEAKQPHLDSLMGSLSKLEPSLSLESYLCWKWGHSQAGAGRRRRTVISAGCALGAEWQPCRRSLAVRAVNLARKLLQPRALLEIRCCEGALEPSWGPWAGYGVGFLHIQLQSQLPSWAHLSPPAAFECFTERQKCALSRGGVVTLFLFLAWKRSIYSLSSCSWALPLVWRATDLSCRITMSALLKGMLK